MLQPQKARAAVAPNQGRADCHPVRLGRKIIDGIGRSSGYEHPCSNAKGRLPSPVMAAEGRGIAPFVDAAYSRIVGSWWSQLGLTPQLTAHIQCAVTTRVVARNPARSVPRNTRRVIYDTISSGRGSDCGMANDRLALRSIASPPSSRPECGDATPLTSEGQATRLPARR